MAAYKAPPLHQLLATWPATLEFTRMAPCVPAAFIAAMACLMPQTTLFWLVLMRTSIAASSRSANEVNLRAPAFTMHILVEKGYAWWGYLL